MELEPLGITDQVGVMLGWARAYLETMRTEWPWSKLAVVFDIDDTAVPVHLQHSLPEFKKLYHLAKQNRYAVFFVTARPDIPGNYQRTLEQLCHEGFHDLDGLFVMPPDHLQMPNWSLYKKYIRDHEITGKGFHVVLNCGDAWADLFLLPPFGPGFKNLGKWSRKKFILFDPRNAWTQEQVWRAIKFPERGDQFLLGTSNKAVD